MHQIILYACGVINALFVAFHLLLGWNIQRLPSLAPGYRALLHAFNVGGVLMVAFLAAAFLACQADLRSHLGRLTILLGALVYLMRALSEVVFFPHAHWAILVLCVLTAALHLAALRAAPAA
jgi:hypothetical protein